MTKRPSERTLSRRQRADERRHEFFLAKDKAREASGDTERQGGSTPVPQDLPAVELIMEEETILPPLKKQRQEPVVCLTKVLSDASRRRGGEKRQFRIPRGAEASSRDERVVSFLLTAGAGDSSVQERELERSGWKSHKGSKETSGKSAGEREVTSSRRVSSAVVNPSSSSLGKTSSAAVWIAGKDALSSQSRPISVTVSATPASVPTSSSSARHVTGSTHCIVFIT